MTSLSKKISKELWQKFITITTKEHDDSDFLFYLAGGTSKIKDLRGIFKLEELEEIISAKLDLFEKVKSKPDNVIKHFSFDNYNIDQQWILSTLLMKTLHEIYSEEKFGSKIYKSLQLIIKKAMEIDIDLFPCVDDIKRKLWIAGGQPLNFHEEIDRYLYLEVDTSKRVDKLKNVIEDLSFKKREEKRLKLTNGFKSKAYKLLYKESCIRLKELEEQLKFENIITLENDEKAKIGKPIVYAILTWLMIEAKQIVFEKNSNKTLPSVEIKDYPRKQWNIKDEKFGTAFYAAFQKIDKQNIKTLVKAYKNKLRPLTKKNTLVTNQMARYL